MEGSGICISCTRGTGERIAMRCWSTIPDTMKVLFVKGTVLRAWVHKRVP